jgi:GNAT superfamily N-acetyltransferase
MAAAAWPGDDEPATLHLAAYADGAEPVGVVTLLPRAWPARPADEDSDGDHQLRGMAVDPRRQGQGVGSVLLTAALERLAARGATLLWCNARMSAVAFYERGGFRRDGAVFRQPPFGIEHVRMWRALDR